MKTFSLALSVPLLLVAFSASAQPPAGGTAAEVKAAACQGGPEKCGRPAETSRMRQAMREACAKNPASCRERHEKAEARHAQMSAPAQAAGR